MDKPRNLTVHPEGSIKELWSISFPLMISTLASLLMIFVDRLFLSKYSLATLNASVNAGTWAWAYIGGLGMLTAMSEIFVSQYNGAREQEKIGKPVWQMIWAAFFAFLLFIPMALWIAPLLYAGSPYEVYEVQYFQVLMLFGPAYAIMTSLSGFFIGRGKTKLLIKVAIFANIINIVFDRMLIFGVEGVFPEMGIKGAALATSLGYLFQATILFCIFLKKKYRVRYGTGNWKFDFSIFRRCFRVGFPQSVFYFLEIVGFAIFYQMMTTLSETHITISAICQSFMILLSFFYDGLSRGVAAVAGNFIGGKRQFLVKNVIKSGITLQGIFSILLASFFLLDFKKTIGFIFPGQWESSSSILQADLSVYNMLAICLFCTYLYISFEGIRWILAGILTAAGDTFFLLIAGTLSVWLFLLLPVYLIVVRYAYTVEVAWILIVIYSLLSCLLYASRVKKGRWRDIQIIN